MPRYFFSTADGEREFDSEGVELPDQNAARTEGIRYAGSLIRDQPDLLDAKKFRVEVTNEGGHLLHVVVALAFDTPAVQERGRAG